MAKPRRLSQVLTKQTWIQGAEQRRGPKGLRQVCLIGAAHVVAQKQRRRVRWINAIYVAIPPRWKCHDAPDYDDKLDSIADYNDADQRSYREIAGLARRVDRRMGFGRKRRRAPVTPAPTTTLSKALLAQTTKTPSPKVLVRA